jgi:hypothetical protein
MSKLTEEQLQKIVGEIGRLSNEKQGELEREQVEDILRELNLPVELLDEAVIQVKRREVLAIEQRRNRLIMGGIIGVLILGFGGLFMMVNNDRQVLDKVIGQQDQLTLVSYPEKRLSVVNRNQMGELVYQVQLKDAPVGKTLNLSCDWINPQGAIVHQNRYETKEVKTPIWNTQCKYKSQGNVAVGNWEVKMKLGDRLLSNENFTVE